MKKVIEPRNKRLEVMKQNKRGKNIYKKKKNRVGLALIWNLSYSKNGNHCTSTRK
jgi:hypothetical protein